jgi:hypothetical protein
MATLSGEQLARMMRGEKPEIRIILTSGYPFDMEPLLAEGGPDRAAFLHKPFTPAMLAETVARLLRSIPKTAC